MTRALIASFIIAASVGVSSASFAQVVFQDDFSAENGGTGAVNYAAFANWMVGNGSVDLIGNGFFDFFPGNGLYVDLDGATADAGTLTSASIAVSPGAYQLQFNLGCGCGFGNDSMLVTLGGDYSETFDATDAGASPNFNVISRPIQVTSAGSVSLVFDHAGGDNFGLVIDNVSLTRLVPEPASLALIGLSSLGILVRRR